MPKITRVPTLATDADGAPIYHIPTASSSFKIDASDIDAIGPGPFFSNTNGADRLYVRTMTPANLATLARVLMNAGKGEIVRYRDGDPSNLRRNNMFISRGRSKRADRDLMPESGELLAAE